MASTLSPEQQIAELRLAVAERDAVIAAHKAGSRLCETVFQAPAPELPIEKGRPGPGLLAHIAISKYCDGIPLYRHAGTLPGRAWTLIARQWRHGWAMWRGG